MDNKLLLEFYNKALFDHLFEILKGVVDEGAALNLCYRIMNRSAFEILSEYRDRVGPLLSNDPCEWISFIFSLWKAEVSCKREDGSLIAEVENGFLRYAKGIQGLVIVMGTLAGALESLTGKKVRVELDGRKFGHPQAQVVLKLEPSERLLRIRIVGLNASAKSSQKELA